MDAEQLEAELRAACDRADYARAATLVLEGYGHELLTFLMARLRNDDSAEEVFAILAEDLWVGLPAFAWRSSMRTWVYTLARNAAHRYLKGPQRNRRRNLTLSRHGELSQIVDRARSATQIHRRTEAKQRIRALRERLEPEDQMLLVLRVDRGMRFRELAQVMLGDSEGRLGAAALDRESVRLRKRFERVKADLKRLAAEAGLLNQND